MKNTALLLSAIGAVSRTLHKNFLNLKVKERISNIFHRGQ
jgi:hypothetical protein